MDQPTAIVITASITAMSTLIAAFGGTIISNLHTAKKEKREKRAAVIEEAFQIILEIDHAVDDLLYEAINVDVKKEYIFEKIKGISEKSIRVRVLVRLYIHSLKSLLEVYSENLTALWNAAGRYNAKKVARDPLDEQAKEANELLSSYKECLANVLEELEKLTSSK